MFDSLFSAATTRRTAPALLLASLIILTAGGCDQAAHDTVAPPEQAQEMKIQIPNSIKAEHEELHRQLEDAIKSGGRAGDAARLVADRLNTHFEKEEEYALPPLGLLAPLAQGKISQDMKATIILSDKMRAELPQMLNDHKAIVLALDELANAARNENKPSVVEFTERLRRHAQNEEEVMYPAAMVVGEYLKLRLERGDVERMR